MESKDELKEIGIKNRARYYFDEIIRDFYTNFDNILLNEKLYENTSVYDISIGPKPLRIKFDEIDGFFRVRGGEFRHLVLFDYGFFDKICDKIKYLISEQSGITESINHNFGETNIDSKNSLPIVILIKSVVNKNKNEYYYNIFLEKGSYKDKSDKSIELTFLKELILIKQVHQKSKLNA